MIRQIDRLLTCPQDIQNRRILPRVIGVKSVNIRTVFLSRSIDTPLNTLDFIDYYIVHTGYALPV